MTATQGPRSAKELGLKIDGVNHLTLPVRDHEKSRKFYVEVLGAEMRREPSWDSVRAGRSNSTALAVRICEGAELDLFYQPFGQAQPDQEYPRHGFFVPRSARGDRRTDGPDHPQAAGPQAGRRVPRRAAFQRPGR